MKTFSSFLKMNSEHLIVLYCITVVIYYAQKHIAGWEKLHANTYFLRVYLLPFLKSHLSVFCPNTLFIWFRCSFLLQAADGDFFYCLRDYHHAHISQGNSSTAFS